MAYIIILNKYNTNSKEKTRTTQGCCVKNHFRQFPQRHHNTTKENPSKSKNFHLRKHKH
jgi:hypothetical protein